MSSTRNSVNIRNGKVVISETKKTLPVALIMATLIFLFESILFFSRYYKSREIYDLVVGIALAVFLLLALIKLIFFTSFRTEINVNEISKVSVQKILFGRGKAYLTLRFSGKTRDVLLDLKEAEAVKKQLVEIKKTQIPFKKM